MTDVHQRHAQSFGAVAAEYDAARPSYPDALFEEIERLAGRPLKDADVLDVGAGTGIATRLLAARGARVIAVEPSQGMAAQLHAVSPGIPLVKAGGDELPFHDHSADLVTYAQAFHWTDPAKSVPEAIRVLRPGGSLALWWNVKDRTAAAWIQDQEDRFAATLPSYHYYGTMNSVTDPLDAHELTVSTAVLHWERTVTVESAITDLRSKSYFAVVEPSERERLLDRERATLLELFPDGRVVEPYRLELTVATTA